jgi:hypothetical protein
MYEAPQKSVISVRAQAPFRNNAPTAAGVGPESKRYCSCIVSLASGCKPLLAENVLVKEIC